MDDQSVRSSQIHLTMKGKAQKVESTKRQKICLNVGGTRHETLISTLEKIPGTRLAILAKLREQDESYDSKENEYYFDRHPDAFTHILEYYRQDELHVTDSLCGNALKKELDFWGIYEAEIEACCWGNYSKFLDHRATLANLDSTFGEVNHDDEVEMQKLSSWKRFQQKVWVTLEYPSSRGAKVLMLISIFFVLASIMAFMLESHYWFKIVRYENGTEEQAPDPEIYYPSNMFICDCGGEAKEKLVYPTTEPHVYLIYADYACLAFFFIELLIRFIFAPDKCAFFKGPLNIIDIICIVPQGVSVAIEQMKLGESGETASDVLKVITILRTVRVLRIFKLMKHYSAFKILAYTIKVSTKELLLMVVFLMTGVMIFASVIHYAEEENFTSIFIGFWWALVTMTTVGYGDKHPKNSIGYAIGSLCVMCGVLVIAFTVPIVVNNFTLYYSHAQSRTKLPMKLAQKRFKKPGLVSVQPARENLQRSETPLSSKTTDLNVEQAYDSNLNIQQPENKLSKFALDSKIKATYAYELHEKPNNHEIHARQLVDNLAEQTQQMMNEKRRQYMLAFKRMEEKRKGNKKLKQNDTANGSKTELLSYEGEVTQKHMWKKY